MLFTFLKLNHIKYPRPLLRVPSLAVSDNRFPVHPIQLPIRIPCKLFSLQRVEEDFEERDPLFCQSSVWPKSSMSLFVNYGNDASYNDYFHETLPPARSFRHVPHPQTILIWVSLHEGLYHLSVHLAPIHYRRKQAFMYTLTHHRRDMNFQATQSSAGKRGSLFRITWLAAR